MSREQKMLESVGDYYAGKLAAHGPSPQGVDWNSLASQQLRFEQLCKVIDPALPVSINDFGCGYGALLDFLIAKGWRGQYCGYDIAPAMIDAARRLHADVPTCSFTSDRGKFLPADYTLASGVFNVKLGARTDSWTSYLLETLDEIDALSRLGFAFNVLTSYADRDRMRPDLHYADPLPLFDRCKRRYSPRVALLHDYELFEFTLIVRKSPPTK